VLISADFGDNPTLESRTGGPVECPVCGFHGGCVLALYNRNNRPTIAFSCHHGHEYELAFVEIEDSIGTLAWGVTYTRFRP
jgi:hypothetical protein